MTTECKQATFEFHGFFRRKVKARFDGGKVSSGAGVVLLREVERRTGSGDPRRTGVDQVEGRMQIAITRKRIVFRLHGCVKGCHRSKQRSEGGRTSKSNRATSGPYRRSIGLSV